MVFVGPSFFVCMCGFTFHVCILSVSACHCGLNMRAMQKSVACFSFFVCVRAVKMHGRQSSCQYKVHIKSAIRPPHPAAQYAVFIFMYMCTEYICKAYFLYGGGAARYCWHTPKTNFFY